MAAETVLITGASSGIGLELAKLFAADKANLVLVARSKINSAQVSLIDELEQRLRGETAKEASAPNE